MKYSNKLLVVLDIAETIAKNEGLQAVEIRHVQEAIKDAGELFEVKVKAEPRHEVKPLTSSVADIMLRRVKHNQEEWMQEVNDR